jgi:hypothetical protein
LTTAVRKIIGKINDYAMLVCTLPLIYGCSGGGGGGGLGFLGSFFGGGGSASSGGGTFTSGFAFNGGAGAAGGATGIATIVNPEPASMLLMGSGLVAMAIYNKKRHQKS